MIPIRASKWKNFSCNAATYFFICCVCFANWAVTPCHLFCKQSRVLDFGRWCFIGNLTAVFPRSFAQIVRRPPTKDEMFSSPPGMLPNRQRRAVRHLDALDFIVESDRPQIRNWFFRLTWIDTEFIKIFRLVTKMIVQNCTPIVLGFFATSRWGRTSGGAAAFFTVAEQFGPSPVRRRQFPTAPRRNLRFIVFFIGKWKDWAGSTLFPAYV